MKEKITLALPIVLAVWLMLSITGSAVKSASNLCGNTYPIDYVLYNNWFCEIEEQSK
jgi:hypothetical protein